LAAYWYFASRYCPSFDQRISFIRSLKSFPRKRFNKKVPDKIGAFLFFFFIT